MPFRSGAKGLLLALACAGAACTPGGDAVVRDGEVNPPPGAGIVFGVLGDPPTLDPYSPQATDLTLALVRPLYPSLYRLDPDGSPRPMLARSLTETGRGVEVAIRRARWSNGRAISARDVVASVRRAEPPSGFAAISTVQAVGPRRIRFAGRSSAWRQRLATSAPVLPGGRATPAGGVSGGPFRLASFTPGLEVVYRPNPNWWGPDSRLERISIRFIADLEIMLALLRSGELDGAAPPSSVNLGERLAAAGLDHSARLGWESLWFDLEGAELDALGRAAVARAIDRQRLERGFVRTHGRLTATLHPGPGPAGADGTWRRPERPAVVAGPARGSEGLLPLQVAVAGGDELAELVQRALRPQLEDAGFSVELVNTDAATFYGPWRQQDPMDIAIRRTSGAPGSRHDGAALRESLAVPWAQVETFVAWGPGLTGPAANPTLDGPLWNLQRWRLTPSAARR